MAKATEIAATEVIGQGSVLEVSTDDGATFTLLDGLEAIPKFGLEGSFVEAQAIHEVVKRFRPGVQTPPSFEMAFRRIGNNVIQDALIAAADARQDVKFRVFYNTGDIIEQSVSLSASYMGEASQGDSMQMAGVMGQLSGAPIKTKVA